VGGSRRIAQEVIAVDETATVASILEGPVTLFEELLPFELGNEARIEPWHGSLRRTSYQTG